ncbi:glycosyltransferase [Psychromonas sp. L1A2]|uniref:glycosyltransferase n=1 Tax=Psychromonas sp. L1A2 TaxID=2686356 RepID=UPI00135C808D|nr:glycosyltransferase [Psychromonas sp. L1A2]
MKVTVYLVTFNRKILLERAILSVIKQTYKNIELIVVDDCSSDGTKEFLESKFEEYNCQINFRFYINDKNKGACYSRNKAIKKAYGEFITGLDDDDYFLPERIEKFVAVWPNKEKRVKHLFSNYRILSVDNPSETLRSKVVKQSDLFRANHIGNQLFTKKENLLAIGGFDESMPAWQDLECWYRLLKYGDAECIEDVTYVFDCSHPHERISTSNIKKIFNASKKFKIKHGCNWVEKNRLDNQLISYKFNFLLYVKCFVVFLLSLDWKGIKNLHSRIIRVLGLTK